MKPRSMAEQMTEAVAASSNNTTMLVLFRQRFEGPSLMRGEQAVSALLSAFELLTNRGNGSAAWASPFRDNALAFLLDSMSDAANLWGSAGELLYRNRAAEQLGIGRCDDTRWRSSRFAGGASNAARRAAVVEARNIFSRFSAISSLRASPPHARRSTRANLFAANR